MAIEADQKPCNLVLHDDSISSEDVLCGANLLSADDIAYLVAPGAKALCIQCQTPAPNPDEISIHVSVAKIFGFKNRMKASIQLVSEIETATATHVEVFFRDIHLSRADMWRIKSQTDSSVLYEGQMLSYLGSPVASIGAIYISGRQVLSAFISHPRTKLIFRSVSARFTILIQISKEMLESWNGGDLLYETMLAGFLPELFRRWDQLKVRHQVSVVLFGRHLTLSNARNSANGGAGRNDAHDFYHLVALDTPSGNWRELIRKLRRAFNDAKLPRQVCLAASGNMLEAVHMAAMDFTDSNVDPRLAITGGSVVAITAGAGLFQTDYDALKCTTELLMGSNTGVDIVCLSPKPLHPVPLFQYERDEQEEYALPHWLDISFWAPGGDEQRSRWLYENALTEVHDIKIERLGQKGRYLDSLSAEGYMSRFDEETFSPPSLALSRPVRSALNKPAVDNRVEENGTPMASKQDVPAAVNNFAKAIPSVARDDTHSKTSSSTSTQPNNGTKAYTLYPHPLMQTDRKISLGPRGLAPSASIASATISAQHAQQGRDTSSGSYFTANETTSGLAKQIKASLRKKPSQQSLDNHTQSTATESSKPVSIPGTKDKPSESLRDPASVIEEALMKPTARSMEDNTSSRSSTPRATPASPSLSQPDPFEVETGLTLPWLRLLNPCHPRKDNMEVATEYRQWQNVFPRALGSDVFKWKSLCSPAALPLIAEGRFAFTDLEKYFDKKVRRLSLSTSNKRPAQQAMWQLIAVRLSAGFQAVSMRRLSYNQMPLEHRDRVLLSLGDQYHELHRLSDSEIQITEYEGKSNADTPTKSISYTSMYNARLRPTISVKEHLVQIGITQRPAFRNWSMLDDECINGSALATSAGMCRMRFVLIPMEPPRTETQGVTALRELSDDERRLEGIQKLTQMWQRHRYFTDDDQRHQTTMIKTKTSSSSDRDPNPLAIEYQTRDTSLVVGAYGMHLTGQVDGDSTSRLFAESEQYHSSNFDIAKLAKQMQEPPPEGVDFRDRRWLTRLHLKCFRGDEMTNWLLRVFKDLQTREDAVSLGNQLMDRGMFTHVRGKHEFRDGNYFYQIRAAYRTTDYPDTTGFFSKPLGRSTPTTPMTDQRQSPSGPSTQVEVDSSQKNTPTPTLTPADARKKKEVLLSQQLQYNVDMGRKSNQIEVVNLHYDRIHNPENCYHILLDWTNTTPKLIRESVARWTAAIENHGLKLVQLPINEACKYHEHHPFDQPTSVKLASVPPERPLATPQLDPQTFSPRSMDDRNGYHKAILRKNGFVLDLEAAQSFPRSVDVTYSWGRPDYQYTQFVHKSGLLLVQIVNDGKIDFLLLPNRLAQYSSVVASKKAEPTSVESIAQNFAAFCRNETALLSMFDELNKSKGSMPSPFPEALAADNDVPPIELPPHLTHRAMLKNAG